MRRGFLQTIDQALKLAASGPRRKFAVLDHVFAGHHANGNLIGFFLRFFIGSFSFGRMFVNYSEINFLVSGRLRSLERVEDGDDDQR